MPLPKGLDREALHEKRILSAMEKIPRDEFVPVENKEKAYDDCALPIGCAQTISQPFIVALMIQEARVSHESKILEIGTGSGYQTAILAYLGATVYTIEIIPELSTRAEKTLSLLGLSDNVNFRTGDGSFGWPEQAPFDSIIVSAACEEIPKPLCEQLKLYGRLILPLKVEGTDKEELIVITKKPNGYKEKRLGLVKFVPLTHHAQQKQ